MSEALRAEIVTRFERLDALEADWERLWLATPRRCVFSSLAWRRTAWLSSAGEAHFPVVYRGDRVVGILPLTIEEGRLRFVGAEWADYSDLLCAPEDAPVVSAIALEALLRPPVPWRDAVFENLPEGALLLRFAERANPALGSVTHVTPGAPCPTLLLDQDRDAVLEALVSRKSLRKVEKRLARHGELRFRHVEDRDEARRVLPRLFGQHIERWALAGNRSPFLFAEKRRFYERLLEGLDPASELRLSVLEVGDAPLAHHLGFETNGTFTLYKTTFNVDFWELSPGDLLLKNLFEYVRDRPVREFDFTRGEEAYKARFANHVRQNRTLHLFRRSFGGSIRRFRHALRQDARERRWLSGPIRLLRRMRSGLAEILDAARRRGWGGWSVAPLRVAVRAWVFDREDVVLSSVAPETASEPETGLGLSVTIERASLGEIARLAVQHPNRIGIDLLDRARERLKRGDVPWKVRAVDGAVVGVFWTGPRNEIVGPAGPWKTPSIPLATEATVVLDLWKISDDVRDEVWAEALRRVIRSANGDDVRILVTARDRTSRRVLAQLRHRPTHRLGGVHLLRLFRRSWVHDVEGGGAA